MAIGAHVVPAKFGELSNVLGYLSAADVGALDASVARWMSWPLGRRLTALYLPLTGSVRVCLMNLEPAGLIFARRTDVSARILALAVAPDMRRRGLARALLVDALNRAKLRGLQWLWLSIPASNTAGAKCALACGFRRYRPQLLRRDSHGFIPSRPHHVTLEALHGPAATRAIIEWLGRELHAGDAWVAGLVEAELAALSLPTGGRTWLCRISGQPLGCAHLDPGRPRPAVTLWLDPAVWNTAEEIWLLRAVLDTLHEPPPALDLRLGSEGHLRASVARYKTLQFTPALEDSVIFVQAVPAHPRRPARRAN